MKKFYILFILLTSFAYAQEPFIFTWEVESSDLSIDILVFNPSTTNYTVNFGDGTILSNQSLSSYHLYNSAGIYTVTISGDYSRIAFGNIYTQPKLKTVEQWGSAQWDNMSYMFQNCENLTINATDVPNVSQVTDMSYMFFGCAEMNTSFANWDVSHVTNMTKMFYQASSFNQPLNSWDVSSVTNMQQMFDGAYEFNQSLNNWNVSNVTNMEGMFRLAVKFNHPLNNWDVSSVNTMKEMFLGCYLFNQPINNWNVSNVTDMEGMFGNSESFNQPLEDWDVSNVTNMKSMFNGCGFNQPINLWNVSDVINMESMFAFDQVFNQPLNSWDVSNVTNMRNMFYNATVFNREISNWNFNNVVDLGTNFGVTANFLSGSGLDILNYEALLLKFAQLGLVNKAMGATGLLYCEAGARNYLINNLGWTITGDSLGDECQGNTIVGTVLYDQNNNGCDSGDASLNNLLVTADNTLFNYAQSMNSDGAFNLTVPENNYNVHVLNLPDYYTANPASSTVNFTGFGNSEEINFCLTANQQVSDLNVTLLPLTDASQGFEAEYQLVIQNMGTQTVANAAVNLAFDNTLQTFVSSMPAASSTTANSLNFIVDELHPFESTMINLTMTTFTPPTVNGGEVINFVATVTPDTNDFTPMDNTFILDQVVVNSFDPNDKRVLQGISIFEEQTGEYLDYIIRFQNTGTASAITVRVEDELHENLDWTTLTLVSSSHDYTVQVTDGNKVEFIFNNINLPHEAANAEGSNGFIAYKVKPVAGIEVGEVMSGDASIFFDYNLPIITNEVVTEVVANLATANFEIGKVSIYPNPAKGMVHIGVPVGTERQEVKVYNMRGRELLSFMQQEPVSVESLNSGIYILAVKTNSGVSKHQLIKN